jgi:hypothetical protein
MATSAGLMSMNEDNTHHQGTDVLIVPNPTTLKVRQLYLALNDFVEQLPKFCLGGIER